MHRYLISTLRSGAYYASKEALSQRRRNQIKRWLSSNRKRWALIYRLTHGSYTAQDLIDQIRKVIACEFEILMVHSAYDRMLPMYSGTAQELVRELIHFCGSDRTLVMPAFVLGGTSGDPLTYYRTHKFDVIRTPSEMGLLTEIFRRMSGVKRSLHPTHSVCALGPLSKALISNHHLANTPSGRQTPFEVMAQKKTVIVGLGVEYYRCLTQIHTAEHILGEQFPVPFQQDRLSMYLIDETRTKTPYTLRVLRSDAPLDARVLRSLLPKTELREWRYRGTPLFMTSADKVTNCLIEAANKGVTVYRSRSGARKTR